jgi:hypothetical protein
MGEGGMDIARGAWIGCGMPGAEKEAVTIEPWAARIGLGTLALVASVAVFTAWDHAHTGTLEDVAMPTAVEDTHFVQAPMGKAGPIGVQYQGQKLDMVTERKIRDSRVIRVGMDDSGVYSIYRRQEEKEGGRKEGLFVKVRVNEFMEVKEEGEGN